jgi:pimeloyl-ACP methyl ester carboxylesterase
MNHVAISSKEPIRPRLAEITAPTLVIHGDEDPVFPLGHGEALAREIPDAELLVLGGSGHLPTRPVWDRVIPAILGISSTPEDETP